MRRLGMRLAWTAVALAGFWTSAATVWGADEAQRPVGEELLPKDVLVFMSFPSIPDCQEKLDASLLGQLLRDPEVQPFLEACQQKIEEHSGAVKDELGVSLKQLMAIPQGEITFAVVQLPAQKLGLTLMIDYGENSETIDKLLDKLELALKDAGGEVEGEDVEGVNIRTFTFETEAELPFNQFAYFDHESYLVLASSPDVLKAILERWDGESDDTFAEHDVYAHILEKCSTDEREPLFKWFIDPMGLTQSVITMVQAQVPQAAFALGFLPVLGLNNLKGIGGGGDVAVEDYDAISKTFIYVQPPASGLLALFQFPATDLSPPDWVPADANMYSAMNWNAAAAYSAVEKLVDGFQGRGQLAKLLDQLAEEDPGIHIKKDLVDQLAGEIHVVMGAADDLENPTPKLMVAVDIKNESKMLSVLAKAAKSDSFQGETREFEGTTVYELAGPEGQGASLAVANKHLLISTDTSLLENALRPRSNTEPLSNDPVYKKLAEKFPKKTSMLSFQNGNNQLETLFQMLKSGNIPDLPEDVRDVVSKLPDYSVIEKYLRANGGYTVPDEKGALSVSFTLKDQE